MYVCDEMLNVLENMRGAMVTVVCYQRIKRARARVARAKILVYLYINAVHRERSGGRNPAPPTWDLACNEPFSISQSKRLLFGAVWGPFLLVSGVPKCMHERSLL